MAAPFALRGERETVRLLDVPLELRKEAANLAARRWGLTGYDYLELMLVAATPRHDVELVVDVAKIELVKSGRLPPGPIPVFEDPTKRKRAKP